MHVPYKILRRCTANAVTRDGSVISLSMHPPTIFKPFLTSRPTPTRLPACRIGAVTTQRRLFHQTQSRHSLLGSLDPANLAICSFTIFMAVRLFQITTGWSTLPPHTWARTADQQTREEVEVTLGTAFSIARKAPSHQRHKKLREASFLVPYEVARLNKKAPDFHLEDLGPVSNGLIPWDKEAGGPPLDAKTETRAFLYFPNGSPKATAVFLSVNSELRSLTKTLRQSPGGKHRHLDNSDNSIRLLKAFVVTHKAWQRSRPELADRMRAMSQLPVICNFQESVFGFAYYPGIKLPGFPVMVLAPLDVTDFGLKTWEFLK